MRIDTNNPFQIPEEHDRLSRMDDGRSALLQRLDAWVINSNPNDDAEENRKPDFVQSGDTVQISREAREMQRSAASENPDEKDRQTNGNGAEDKNARSGFAQDDKSTRLNGTHAAAQADNQSEEDDGKTSTKIRKQIREAQKRLEQAQIKLNEALAEMQGAEDEMERMDAQVKVQGAETEVNTINTELQLLNTELQKAIQAEAEGGESGWAPSGKRVEVNAKGTVKV